MSALTLHFLILVLPLLSNNTPSTTQIQLSKEKAHLIRELLLRHGTNHPNGIMRWIVRKPLTTLDSVKRFSTPIEQECPPLNEISYNASHLIIIHNPLPVMTNFLFPNEAHQLTNIQTPMSIHHVYKSTITAPILINGSTIQIQKS